MINTVINSGEYFVWVLLIVSVFVYILAEVTNVRASVNGVQMETMVGKVYVMFALQIAIGMTVVIFPFVKIFLGYAWFNTLSSTLATLLVLLVAMVIIRNVALQAKEVEGLRVEGERLKKSRDPKYKYYLISMWSLLLSAACGSGLLVRHKGEIDMLWKDVGVVNAVLLYLLIFRLVSKVMISRVGKIEELDRNKEG